MNYMIEKDITKVCSYEEISENVSNNTRIILIELKDNNIEEYTDIYPTPYGTICIDWDRKEDTLSLEVGADTYGYFCEIGGRDVKLVDNCSVSDTTSLINDLNEFLKLKSPI